MWRLRRISRRIIFISTAFLLSLVVFFVHDPNVSPAPLRPEMKPAPQSHRPPGNQSEPIGPNCSLYGLQKCQDRPLCSYSALRDTQYWVMYNFVTGSRRFACDESVTYTTHGDFTFVDNLEPLVRRWRGPVSFSLYAPGEDFAMSVYSVGYLRQCGDPLITEFVTFHIFYDVNNMPLNVSKAVRWLDRHYDCERPPPWSSVTTFRKARRITYPINVARNVARETVMTHFVLPSDTELMPSAGVAEQFLAMIRRNAPVLCQPRPKVFVLSVFEVSAESLLPLYKNQLLAMLRNSTAIPFHRGLCAHCHSIPKAEEWASADETGNLDVFHVAKRHYPHQRWEPFFICTNEAPSYDERLTWEGRRDKMEQSYAMCLQDYDFMVLNDAFLVHTPGIKVKKHNPWIDELKAKQRDFIETVIQPEFDAAYGARTDCVLVRQVKQVKQVKKHPVS